MSHPRRYAVRMNRINPISKSSLPNQFTRSQADQVERVHEEGAIKVDDGKSGLLAFCHEVSGLLIRRQLEVRNPQVVCRFVRSEIVRLMSCSEERAGWIVDLSLELIHVKINGSFKRNPLELSLLIARAGNQLRRLSDN